MPHPAGWGSPEGTGLLPTSPDDIGVQNFSEFLRRMGPMLCRVDELMTDGPCRKGVMGAVAEVGG